MIKMTSTKARVIYFVKELGGIITGDGDYCTAHLDHQVDGEAFVALADYEKLTEQNESYREALEKYLETDDGHIAREALK